MNELLKLYSCATTIEEQECVLKIINMKKRNKLTEVHNFKIWQGSNAKWYTYIYDTEEKKRKLIKKATEEKLYNYLLEIYFPPPKIWTIRELYTNWRKYKEQIVNSSNTIYRIDKDWERFYINNDLSTDIIDRDITTLKPLELEGWMCSLIKSHSLTKKAFYNMSIIPRSIFNFAVEQEILLTDNYAKIKINSSLFRKTRKPESNTQVFTQNEQTKLIEIALKQYRERKEHNIYLYTVPLAFFTGLRIGELLALQWCDIEKNYLHVHQSLKKERTYEDDCWIESHYEVKDSLKQNANERSVLLTPLALSVLSEIRQHYVRNNETPTYIFEKNGTLAAPGSIYNTWVRLCKKINIKPRSPHKARKSFISTLIANDLPLNYIREISGHEDEQTTLRHYCYTLDSDDLIQEKMINALDSNLAFNTQ